LDIEAKNEEEAREIAEGMGNTEIGSAVEDIDGITELTEPTEYICGNCGRPHTNEIIAGISRCDRCRDL